ncbi:MULTISPECIES: hypothetical protein [unclassified Undibacterium]|uniref:hypothetical protein n=1 Tax=unclassified Undibacterium TaxID=2630295 RepID=UPI002AC94CC9|nr:MULTISPECIES: hypothetical protein [unclassified Undibacterium]MEB0138532.1 hypothetical protein [Undibacterium sp. CCC2.1]MEB0171404.1 hypothetical protein [Undibacterium sp. CCC1.1]MEB0175296.1 hypothetical protein [Undibacterium sp. CCC3.4]MEB0214600.1 hypothetical protein [Undibacterium sp. 5I2]WPX43027.1 hypothetical protein RHM61_16845 [Undibacterium sp. CCC3.4]
MLSILLPAEWQGSSRKSAVTVPGYALQKSDNYNYPQNELQDDEDRTVTQAQACSQYDAVQKIEFLAALKIA